MTDHASTFAEWLDSRSPGLNLGPKAARVRHLLTTQPSFCAHATAGEVAERAGVNGATVTRFAQTLGFTGWPQFQAEFRAMFVLRRYDLEVEPPTSGPEGVVASAFARDAENLQACLRSFDYGAAMAVVDAIHASRHTVVVATGTHALPAQALAMMATSRGYDIRLEDRGGAHLANALAAVTSEDCVVGFSFWQHYKQTVAALNFARQVGATTCVVTDTRHSPAAEGADHVLVVPAEGVSGFRSMSAAMSLAYGLAAALVAAEPGRSRSAITHVDEFWRDMDIFVPDTDGR